MAFFRIGTGGTGGTYYPIGGLLANAISNPPGSRACDEGGSCGVPGLIASALSANGSVANINAQSPAGRWNRLFAVRRGDVWAYTGTGIWEGKPPVSFTRHRQPLSREHPPREQRGVGDQQASLT
ncbi:MAG: hypothetical protein M9957_01165 [Rhodobacteraceae bacterium]|nr:hypothetical protein [Paracoccaceae bacterium]